MTAIVFLSFGVGIVLILLIRGTTPPVTRKEEMVGELAGIDIARFEELCVLLVRDLDLEIKHVGRAGTDGVDIIAAKGHEVTGGDYVIQCLLRDDREPVGATRVRSLSDTVKAEGALKGVMITTGRFCEEAFTIADGAPMTLLDRPAFLGLLREHGIAVGEGTGAA